MTLSNNQVHELLDYLNAREREREELACAAMDTKPRYAWGDSFYDQPIGQHWGADQGLVYATVTKDDEPLDVGLWDCEGSDTLCMQPEPAAFIAAHDPAWARDDVYVKSYLLALFARLLDTVSHTSTRTWVSKTLQVMARPYQGREDFKAEWVYKPDLPAAGE